MDYLQEHALLGAFIATVSMVAIYSIYKTASGLYQDFIDFSQRFRGVK
jgi:cell division protein FtsL